MDKKTRERQKKAYKKIPEKEFEVFTHNDELYEKALKESKEVTEPLRFIPVKSVEYIEYENKPPPPERKYQLNYWRSDIFVSTILKCIFEKHGFRPVKGGLNWNVTMASIPIMLGLMRKMNQYQRMNRFPCCLQLTRKHNMYTNYLKMKRRFPEDFDYLPLTFRFPYEFPDFLKYFGENKKSVWIIKPPTLSRGRGVRLITSPNDVTRKMMCDRYVCSKYIDDPYLINGMKFDMRIYVFVTSFLPLRAYIYENSFVRFATEEYKNEDFVNLFRHITNFTINSKNPKFVIDENSESGGTNWSLKAFKKYMIEERGVDFDKIDESIKDIVVKSLLTVEDVVVTSMRKDVPFRNNCFQIFGYDMMLDSNLNVHLLEVNFDPSLKSYFPLRFNINSPMMASFFDMLRIRGYDRRKIKDDPYQRFVMTDEIKNEKANDDDELTIVENMIIHESKDEISKKGGWNLAYPCADSEKYDRFFFEKRNINTILREALYKS